MLKKDTQKKTTQQDIGDKGQSNIGSVPPSPARTLSRADTRKWATNQPPPMDFVLPGLRAGVAGFLASPGGTSKSYWAFQTAMQIASGHQFMGFDTKQGKVTYVSIEDDEEMLWNRFNPIAQKFFTLRPAVLAATRDDIQAIREQEKIHAVQLGDALEAMHENLWVHVPAPGAIDILTNPFCLDEFCQGQRLVVIDTLRLAHSGDENSGIDMSKLVANVLRSARAHKCAIMILAHTTKSAALNGLVDIQQAIRGSTVLTDNMRWQSYMASMSTEEAEVSASVESAMMPIGDDRDRYVRFGISKANASSKGEPIWYYRGDHGVLTPTVVIKAVTVGKRNRKASDEKL